MKLLVLTTLFPNAAMPAHGIFVENRLRALRAETGAEVRVIAPVPWFPARNDSFGHWARWAQVAPREMRDGVEIIHPRYFLPPKVGMTYAATALTRCFDRAVRQQQAAGFDPDLIDAHYYYPDGVGAVRVARAIEKPVVVTARGTDINLIPNYARQRRMILEAARAADHTVTVAEALRQEMIRLGAVGEKITTLRNGVDLTTFRETDPVTARTAIRASHGLPVDLNTLGEDGFLLASVGHLIERKGHDRVIKALTQLPTAHLIIAGDGPAKGSLIAEVKRLGVTDRVHFLGRIPHDSLSLVYGAADITVLASSREGWPNVLLESMASGTPCVATPVWGSGEVIRAPEAGALSKDRSPEAIAEAIHTVRRRNASDPQFGRSATRAYAAQHGWEEIADRTAQLYEDIIRIHRNQRSMTARPALKSPAILKAPYRPHMLVTVDTEEAFDWSSFTGKDHSVCHPKTLDRFQTVCRRHAITPLYFLTWPVITNNLSAQYFRRLVRDEMADLGLHLHQWVTPPLDEFTSRYYSYQNNLPQDCLRQKLAMLATRFQDVFGFNTDLHRAGRYGIDPQSYRVLSDLNLLYDFSPSAGFDFSAEGGPNFSTMGNQPFSMTDETAPAHRPVHVTPVCGAHAVKYTRTFNTHSHALGFHQTPRTEKSARGVSPLSRAGQPTIPMRLSPEGASLEDLRALTRHLVRERVPILTFTLHSTSLTPGATDYTETDRDVDAFLDLCTQYFDLFTQQFDGAFIGAADVRARFADGTLNGVEQASV
ncbi:MAG: glycosyltransferase [Pseudomonadota bacterium]